MNARLQAAVAALFWSSWASSGSRCPQPGPPSTGSEADRDRATTSPLARRSATSGPRLARAPSARWRASTPCPALARAPRARPAAGRPIHSPAAPGPPARTAQPASSSTGPQPDGLRRLTPPDTTGDVGPNHYIQLVNATKVAIYKKSGTLLPPPSISHPGRRPRPCSLRTQAILRSTGDGLANRWVLSQFYLHDQICFAVSQTANPMGSYFTYRSRPRSSPTTSRSGLADRLLRRHQRELLHGLRLRSHEDARGRCRPRRGQVPGRDQLPDACERRGDDGSGPQGGLFYTFKDDMFHGGADRLQLFRLTPDFAVPASSTFASIGTFPITAFTYTVCGFFNLDCIPQPGPLSGSTRSASGRCSASPIVASPTTRRWSATSPSASANDRRRDPLVRAPQDEPV